MRQEKQLLGREIEEGMKSSSAYVITSYKKMTPKMVWQLANLMRKNKGYFEAVKKRIFYKTIEKTSTELKLDKISGHLGILFLKDEALSGIKSFVALNEEWDNFEIQAAIFEGKTYKKNEVIELSKLPTLPVLQSQFLGVLEAPASQLVGVMQSLLSSILYCLENKKTE